MTGYNHHDVTPPLRYAEWMDDGLCRQVDPDSFFPDPSSHAEVRAARVVCQGCPVRLECLDWAIKYREGSGIWGGMTPRQRVLHSRGFRVEFTTTVDDNARRRRARERARRQARQQEQQAS